MADDGPTSPADSPAYQHAADDGTPVPVASTISFNRLNGFEPDLVRLDARVRGVDA